MLSQPQITEDAAALREAEQIINQAIQVAARIHSVLENGVLARPAEEARTLPDGRVIPARPGAPAISAAKIRTALGTENVASLEEAYAALTA